MFLKDLHCRYIKNQGLPGEALMNIWFRINCESRQLFTCRYWNSGSGKANVIFALKYCRKKTAPRMSKRDHKASKVKNLFKLGFRKSTTDVSIRIVIIFLPFNPFLHNWTLWRLKLKAFYGWQCRFGSNNWICLWQRRKHLGQRRKCWVPVFSSFPKIFSKAFFLPVPSLCCSFSSMQNLRTWLGVFGLMTCSFDFFLARSAEYEVLRMSYYDCCICPPSSVVRRQVCVCHIFIRYLWN